MWSGALDVNPSKGSEVDILSCAQASRQANRMQKFYIQAAG